MKYELIDDKNGQFRLGQDLLGQYLLTLTDDGCPEGKFYVFQHSVLFETLAELGFLK